LQRFRGVDEDIARRRHHFVREAIANYLSRVAKDIVCSEAADLRNAVKRMLMTLGYEVIDVTTGQEAIAVLQSDTPIDLLFTDMILPGGIGGSELARAAEQLRPGIRILLTSGYTQTKALPTGSDGSTSLPLISKPYTKAELAERLAQVFGS
jgi:CheY-like chemotaxis protein